MRSKAGGVFEYASDFDTNGVLYWLGTDGGTTAYTNPHTSGKITVTPSSIGVGTAAGFIEHARVGDRVNRTDNTAGSFVAVRLPVPLVVTRYTLRNDGNATYALRRWVLEGSEDGAEGSWVVLKTHAGDTALATTAMSAASWDVDPAASGGRGFAHLRVRQTGKNARAGNSGGDYLMMAGLELYGHVDGVDTVRVTLHAHTL